MSHLAKVWFSVTDRDFTGATAVTSTGHCHPRVVAAIQAQAARFVHA